MSIMKAFLVFTLGLATLTEASHDLYRRASTTCFTHESYSPEHVKRATSIILKTVDPITGLMIPNGGCISARSNTTIAKICNRNERNQTVSARNIQGAYDWLEKHCGNANMFGEITAHNVTVKVTAKDNADPGSESVHLNSTGVDNFTIRPNSTVQHNSDQTMPSIPPALNITDPEPGVHGNKLATNTTAEVKVRRAYTDAPHLLLVRNETSRSDTSASSVRETEEQKFNTYIKNITPYTVNKDTIMFNNKSYTVDEFFKHIDSNYSATSLTTLVANNAPHYDRPKIHSLDQKGTCAPNLLNVENGCTTYCETSYTWFFGPGQLFHSPRCHPWDEDCPLDPIATLHIDGYSLNDADWKDQQAWQSGISFRYLQSSNIFPPAWVMTPDILERPERACGQWIFFPVVGESCGVMSRRTYTGVPVQGGHGPPTFMCNGPATNQVNFCGAAPLEAFHHGEYLGMGAGLIMLRYEDCKTKQVLPMEMQSKLYQNVCKQGRAKCP